MSRGYSIILTTNMITRDYVNQLYEYNPSTGDFIRKTSRGGSLAGSVAGAKDKLGYVRLSIDGRLYLAHRLAFLIMEGKFPEGNVDHKDGNPSNNSWNNLRNCTQQQNIQNSKGRGKYYKNVYFTGGGRNKPYNVKIEVNGVIKSFGYYATPEEADEVASLIRDMLHGDFSVSKRENNEP